MRALIIRARYVLIKDLASGNYTDFALGSAECRRKTGSCRRSRPRYWLPKSKKKLGVQDSTSEHGSSSCPLQFGKAHELPTLSHVDSQARVQTEWSVINEHNMCSSHLCPAPPFPAPVSIPTNQCARTPPLWTHARRREEERPRAVLVSTYVSLARTARRRPCNL